MSDDTPPPIEQIRDEVQQKAGTLVTTAKTFATNAKDSIGDAPDYRGEGGLEEGAVFFKAVGQDTKTEGIDVVPANACKFFVATTATAKSTDVDLTIEDYKPDFSEDADESDESDESGLFAVGTV